MSRPREETPAEFNPLYLSREQRIIRTMLDALKDTGAKFDFYAVRELLDYRMRRGDALAAKKMRGVRSRMADQHREILCRGCRRPLPRS